MKQKDIILFGGIDWNGKAKFPVQHVVYELSQRNRVFYIDNFGAIRDFSIRDSRRALQKIRRSFPGLKRTLDKQEDVSGDVIVCQPKIIPTPRLPSTIGRINGLLLRRCLQHLVAKFQIVNPVIWTRVPTMLVWESIRDLNRSALVYQSVDKFPESPKIAKGLKPRFTRSERLFCKAADLVFASAQGLYREKVSINPNTYFFPNGVNFDLFAHATGDIPELEQITTPIIGFAGSLGPWIDYKLLSSLAQKRTDLTFVFVGRKDPKVSLGDLEHFKNVHIYGPVNHKDLPKWYKRFDVGIIPYSLTKFTQFTFPSKMAEYLAAGLPVVSTALPELLQYSEVVYIAKDLQKMSKALDDSLCEAVTSDVCQKRIKIARDLSWPSIVEKMEHLLNNVTQ